MATSSMSLFFVFALLVSPLEEVPPDLLSAVDPAIGLEALGQKRDVASLASLIAPPKEAAAAAPAGPLSRQLQSAIQNLASRSERLRKRARDRLVEEGQRIVPHLEKVVASDERRAAEARRVLAVLAGRKAASRHDELVARQLAIALCGAEKIAALEPALRRAAGDPSPFVRLAARRALAAMKKEVAGTKTDPTAVAPLGTAEVEALSADTRLLLVVKLRKAGSELSPGVTIRSLLEKAKKSLGEDIVDSAESDSKIDEASRAVVDWVQKYGNLRPDHAVMVNVGGVGPRGGGLGFILQGLYEPAVLKETLGASPLWTSATVGDYEVFNSPFLRLVCLSDRSVLLLPTMASAHFPLEEYLKDLAAGRKTLRASKRYGRFLATLADESLARGLTLTDETLMSEVWEEAEREMPAGAFAALRDMKEIELAVSPVEGRKLRVRLEAAFSSSGKADALATWLRSQIEAALGEMRETAERFDFPAIRTFIGIFEAIKVTAEDKRGILRFVTPPLGIADIAGSVFSVRSVR